MKVRAHAIAIAAMLAATGAAAQSSVTVFGLVDLSIGQHSNTSKKVQDPFNAATLFAPDSVKTKATMLSSAASAPSLLGFRGTEDLGGGYSAGFWLESTIAPDTGATALSQFDRRATVSISGPFGELRLGRDYVPTYWNLTIFDPFTSLGVGANILNPIGVGLNGSHGPVGAGLSADNFIRAGNSIGYFLPKNLGGFYGQFMYTFHERTRNSLAVGETSAGRYYGGRVGYANGPLNVAVAYGVDNKDGMTGFGHDRMKTFNVGASYDFGVAKLWGQYADISESHRDVNPNAANQLALAAATGKSSYRGGLLGVTVPVGQGLIKATYARAKYNEPDNLTTMLSAQSNDASVSRFAVGYVHNLSKRTAVYAQVALTNFKWKGAVNPAMAIAPGAPVPHVYSVPGQSASYRPDSSMGYNIGIRHMF